MIKVTDYTASRNTKTHLIRALVVEKYTVDAVLRNDACEPARIGDITLLEERRNRQCFLPCLSGEEGRYRRTSIETRVKYGRS